MYPNLYYVFKDLFGIEIEGLRFVNSFGFFVAIAFIIAAIILSRELQRKSGQGFFQPTEMQITVGEPAKWGDLLLNFLLGFLLGYKILALFILSKSATDDPQAFIFSLRGSWPAGIALGLLFAGLKWWDKKKTLLPKPEKRTVRIWPHDRVGEITILALIFGLLGAKLFDIFENWSDFVKKPSAYIFSPAGLTMYGGLICAALAIWWYAKKHKISFWHLNDAAAPALMIAYAIGRIGCQVAGDGDWGIHNSAYAVDNKTEIYLTTPASLDSTVNANADYFTNEFGSLSNIPSANFRRPRGLAFLPHWFFAYDFPHNVNESGVQIANCEDVKYCKHLPVPVFPTPLYETIVCGIFFFIIWGLRKRFTVPGTLFGFYLLLNGIERFFIEKIRVNIQMKAFGIRFTQAELIALLLIITGITIWIIRTRKRRIKTD
jgi:prolipoprotein diacylglyceryltransferase